MIHSDEIIVNLFLGSEAEIKLKENSVKLTQETNYPWNGKIAFTVNPESSDKFALKLRIPG